MGSTVHVSYVVERVGQVGVELDQVSQGAVAQTWDDLILVLGVDLFSDIFFGAADLVFMIFLAETTFGPGGLRAPCVLACAMRSLAIVFTIVQSFFLSLSLSFFWPRRLECAMRSLAIVITIVQSFSLFFFLFFLSVFCF